LETRDIDQAREITETMSSENGESPNILLKKASVLGLLVRYEEARDILLRLNQDFPGRPADLRRLVIVFKQLRDVRKVAAFLKAYARAVAHDAGASEQRERFAALGFR
jgi:serine/threonine-protein kinase